MHQAKISMIDQLSLQSICCIDGNPCPHYQKKVFDKLQDHTCWPYDFLIHDYNENKTEIRFEAWNYGLDNQYKKENLPVLSLQDVQEHELKDTFIEQLNLEACLCLGS